MDRLLLMNKRLLALLLLSLFSSSVALAQSADEEAPQSEMPSNLTFETDIYFVVPKFTLSFGARGLSGTKSSFRGTGHLESVSSIDSASGLLRTYHDGTVGVDTRGSSTTFQPIAPDGKTNTWSFTSDKQIVGDGIALHTYTADVMDSGLKNKDPGSTYGIEVAVARDMGKLWRFNWNIAGGLSINDINSKMTTQEAAKITTLTDTYSLNGQTLPVTTTTTTNADNTTTTTTTVAPYSSPSTTSETITNDDGTTTTVTTDTTVLLPKDYSSRNTSSVLVPGSVTNRYKLKGAYYTFRAGPTLVLPITQRLQASISAGAALVYAGTTLSVQQDFQPDTGDLITVTEQQTRTHFLPGYYLDADVSFWLTEHAGLYLGALYQNSGDFSQDLKTTNSNYVARVDLSSLQGFRMGMNIKF
jgi:hypothetical protein